MNTIISPVNFSAASNNAAVYAAKLCLQKQVDLWLVHVIMIPVGVSFTPLPDDMVNEMKSKAGEEMNKLINKLKSEVSGGLTIHHSIELGSLEHQVNELVNRRKASYVVMGLSRESADRVVFKSNTFLALKSMDLPLIIVPDNTVYSDWNHITLAYDFASPPKSFPTGEIEDVLNLRNGELQVVYVRKPKKQDPDGEELDAFRKRLPNCKVRFHLMEGSSVEEGLLLHLKYNPADLVLLLPRNHGFFEFHKSDTQKLAGQLSVPVMTIHE